MAWSRPQLGHRSIRFAASAVSVLADAALGIGLARAGTRVASASVTAATAGATLVVVAEIGGQRPPQPVGERSVGAVLRSSAATVGWTGLAWTAATLAEDRNLRKAPLGPALAGLQGITLVTGSTWPNRVASGVAQVATGVVLAGAAARHEDPVGGALALTSSGLIALARVTGWSRNADARTVSAVLDAGARVAMATVAGRLAALGDEDLF